MEERIAALWGTTVGFIDTSKSIVIEKGCDDSRIMVVSYDVFDHLYFKLDEFTAALKEDCIHYTFCDEDKQCVTLRNYLGDMTHMDLEKFDRFYDMGGNY